MKISCLLTITISILILFVGIGTTAFAAEEEDQSTGEKVKEAAEEAGETIEEGGEKVGEAVKESGEAIGEGVEKGEEVGEEAKEGAQEVGEEMKEATQEVGSEVAEAGEEVGSAGGCLIATATFGSEMATQVQFLREVRDETVLNTVSGTAFMSGFNQIYYSFSPTIADWERQNPIFKEFVKITITPMISSLSILEHADPNSELSVLSFGLSIIGINLGMYVAIPTAIVWQIKKRL